MTTGKHTARHTRHTFISEDSGSRIDPRHKPEVSPEKNAKPATAADAQAVYVDYKDRLSALKEAWAVEAAQNPNETNQGMQLAVKFLEGQLRFAATGTKQVVIEAAMKQLNREGFRTLQYIMSALADDTAGLDESLAQRTRDVILGGPGSEGLAKRLQDTCLAPNPAHGVC